MVLREGSVVVVQMLGRMLKKDGWTIEVVEEETNKWMKEN